MFLRYPMGAQDKKCRRGDEALAGKESIRKVVDDILVYGQSNQELLDNTIKLLEQCRRHKITLNPKKFKFGLQEIEYVGYKVNKDGVTVDNGKVDAIINLPKPNNLVQLRSFIGLCNRISLLALLPLLNLYEA